tara:strand:+ start:763 stop:972 length:210 start_codon:yes stop_codon:yes gene_type:complete
MDGHSRNNKASRNPDSGGDWSGLGRMENNPIFAERLDKEIARAERNHRQANRKSERVEERDSSDPHKDR